MSLTIGEANAVNTLLRWQLGLPNALGESVDRDDALAAAELLSEHAYRSLYAGLRPVDVALVWPGMMRGRT